MQTIEETFDIARPAADVYRQINDVGDIGYAISGVKQVTVIDENESVWKIEAKAGFLKHTVDLKGRITERRPPEHLAFQGDGQGVKVTGHIDLEAIDAAATRCHVVVEVQAGGVLGTIADLVAKGAQQRMIHDTIANLRGRLEAPAV